MKKNLQDYCIVIVDDEPMVTSSLKSLLVLEGFNYPIIFNNPVEAVEYSSTNKVDLVVSDFLMPGMNGIELLSKIKDNQPGATLILLTGYADKESAIKAINEIGLYRYIEKPWDSDDLILCIKNGLERSHLLENLEEKIEELSEAKAKLEVYNNQLEHMVQERTQELLKSNGKLSAIIDHCADGIVAINKNGLITQVNPALELITGLNSTELVNKNFSEFFFSSSQNSLLEELDNKNFVLLSYYAALNRKTEKQIPVEISFAPITPDCNTSSLQYVGVIRDVTAQHEMERLREDFIATLTHDLRTPLLAAIQTLHFFLDGSLGELSERQTILLTTMRQSNQDMLGLVNALLEVYKYESGKLQLYKDIFNLNDLVNQCVNEVKSLLEKKEVVLKLDQPELINVRADKQELRRVLANFLGNAINYTPTSGEIRICTNKLNDSVVVSVEDTGTGIPKEDIPQLFGRFSQGTSKKRSTGTGLGLYLSRQIVEAHGGKVWLESELNKGSKFYFSIPLSNKG